MLRTCFLVLSFATIGCVFLRTASAANPLEDVFEIKSYQDAAGHVLPYRFLQPEKLAPGQCYPLVLFLHGAGERGTDNAVQLLHGATEFAKPENRRKYPCFVIAPQCPKGRSWVKAIEPRYSKPEELNIEKTFVPLTVALELVDKLVAELPTDKSRIYITGLSMGGFGTWKAIEERPGFFAAAMPICGGGDPDQAAKLKGVPLWAFHGEKDTIVPVECTKTMIEAIRKAGGSPKATLYPELEHNSWDETYANPEVIAWLFAQKNAR